MSAVVWWLIPATATFAAIASTAILARRERRRADEEWRAKRMAKVGGRLIDTELPESPLPRPDATE